MNLNQTQKVLESSAFPYTLKDYSAFFLDAKPRKGQTLEELKDLLLNQVKLLKEGNFPDWLLPAIINNMKLNETKQLESNRRRAISFVEAFTTGTPWEESVKEIDRLSKITKEDVINFAKKIFGNNYLVVYKRTGEDKNIQKVPKPIITPVKLNRSDKSDFLKNIENENAPEIQPIFVNYNDIIKGKIKKDIQIYYNENKENDLFNLYYVTDFGTNSDKKLGLAIDYLDYIGTSKYTSSELKQEFFKLGCSFSVSSSNDQIYVSLSGINDNFEKGLSLFEEFLSDVQPNKEALDNLVTDILKIRKDNKLDQNKILWNGLYNYGKYGNKSPFTDILSEDELKAITPEELVQKIKEIPKYQHLVLYYGPKSFETISEILNSSHKVADTFLQIPEETKYPELPTEDNKVYFANYPGMVQAEIIFLTKDSLYNKVRIPVISMYNEYFGSGMSGIVFQELRESKALAYNVFSAYRTPRKLDESFYNMSYIGTQADKLEEAVNGILELLNDMPSSEITFNSSKNSLMQQIESSRITKASILFNYLNALKLGLDYDIRKNTYEKVPSMTLKDIQDFQEKFVKGKKHTILVLGDKDKLDMKVLDKLGPVTTLSLEDLFGY
jgi:predicted Zn-dependent peptidase